jgi:hypothetical protein
LREICRNSLFGLAPVLVVYLFAVLCLGLGLDLGHVLVLVLDLGLDLGFGLGLDHDPALGLCRPLPFCPRFSSIRRVQKKPVQYTTRARQNTEHIHNKEGSSIKTQQD